MSNGRPKPPSRISSFSNASPSLGTQPINIPGESQGKHHDVTDTPTYGSFDDVDASPVLAHGPLEPVAGSSKLQTSVKAQPPAEVPDPCTSPPRSEGHPGSSPNSPGQHSTHILPSNKSPNKQQSSSRKRAWSFSTHRTINKQSSYSALYHQPQIGHLVPEVATFETPSRRSGRHPSNDNDDALIFTSDDEYEEASGHGNPPHGPSSREADQPYGVLKMEAIARFWGKKGLMGLYAAVYLLSCLTSLEGNTTPIIEPYFLSVFKGHSFLGTISLLTNISYAVGKAPMAKILDVFGRAEGITTAMILYSLGYIFTACSFNVASYGFARIISALGGQALQLSQQIMVADTSTLTNRGLLTSTISTPWLITTWAGPALGQLFKDAEEPGYRLTYVIFGFLLPIACAPLIGILWWNWRQAKKAVLLEMSERQNSRYPYSGRQQRRRRRASRTPINGTPAGRHAGNVKGPSNTNPHQEGPSYSSRRPSSFASQQSASFDAIGMRSSTYHQSFWQLARTMWLQLDIVGASLLTAGCLLVLVPLSVAATRPESWGNFWIYLSVAIGWVFLGCLRWFEKNFAANPILPERLLRKPTILAGCSLGFFHFACQFAYESYFTSYLQVARFHSAMEAQYIAQSYIFTASISAIVVGLLAKWSRRYKIWGVTGVLIHMIGALMMVRFRGLENPTWEIVLSQVIGGIGGGFTTICAQIGVQSVVGHEDVAITTAVFLTLTQIGGAFGGAAAGGIWTTLLPKRLMAGLPESEHNLIPAILGDIRVAMQYEYGSPERNAVNQAYTGVQRTLNAVALLTLLPALVSVLAMKDVHLARDDKGHGEGVVVLGSASILDHENEGVDSEASSLLGSSEGSSQGT